MVLAFIVLIAILIFVRLYFVQIVHGQDYAQKADQQFASSGNGLFDRGSIYFTRKDGTLISAATLVTGFLVAINPQTLQDPEAAYAAITATASSSLNHDAFLAAAAKKFRNGCNTRRPRGTAWSSSTHAWQQSLDGSI